MKNKKLIIILCSITAVIGLILGLYFYGLNTSVSRDTKSVDFIINSGTSKIDIVNKLKDEGLIKSKFSLYIYVLLNSKLNLQAGTYELQPSMTAKEIIEKLDKGDIKKVKNTFNLTFIEGRRLSSYAKTIADATNSTTADVLAILNDKAYLQELINNYWFLTDDILKEGIYYPLEGYLFPSTYEFYNNSSVKDIVKVMLDTFGSVLKSHEAEIQESNYSVHELLTLASVVELEGAGSNDRPGIAGVFYNRLKLGDNLGSDVTTYYAEQKEFKQGLTNKELNNCNNGYNTRNSCLRGKLPIGPICSPSAASFVAALLPEKHDYLFFAADKYKNTYFTKTNAEHLAKVRELQAKGLWHEFN